MRKIESLSLNQAKAALSAENAPKRPWYRKKRTALKPVRFWLLWEAGQGFPLFKGFKKYTANISAIVNVADDGGSSGRLRENLNMLPPGDIRNCLVALANTEPLLEKVFQHRFTTGDGLRVTVWQPVSGCPDRRIRF